MRLEPKEVEAIECLRSTKDGLVVIVKQGGELRQVTTMQKIPTENRYQMLDKGNKKQ